MVTPAHGESKTGSRAFQSSQISAKTPAAKAKAGRVASVASSGSKRRPSPTETKPKKRRNRDPLAVNAYEAGYLPETSTQGYFHGARAKSESGNAILKMRFNKARVAVRASQKVINEDAMGNITASEDGSLTYTLALARRWSIYFLYEHVLGSPPENKWTGRHILVPTHPRHPRRIKRLRAEGSVGRLLCGHRRRRVRSNS